MCKHPPVPSSQNQINASNLPRVVYSTPHIIDYSLTLMAIVRDIKLPECVKMLTIRINLFST